MADTTDCNSMDAKEILGASARVQEWWTDSTARSVKLRLVTGDGVNAQRDCSFTLDPEQARQLIRDLSSAVQASDLKRALRRMRGSTRKMTLEEKPK